MSNDKLTGVTPNDSYNASAQFYDETGELILI